MRQVRAGLGVVRSVSAGLMCFASFCAWQLHGALEALVARRICNGCMNVAEEAGARNLVFFCVKLKWLRAAMKGTLCVRRVRAGPA